MDISALRRLDLNLLKSLHVLLDTCNVSRAAEQLHLSQPAVSAQLRQLREAFADPLLVPAGRRLVRSAGADGLRAPLQELLLGAERLLATTRAFDPASSSLTLRISSSDLIHQVVSLPLLARLRSRAPQLRVALLPLPAGGIGETLGSGDTDLALVVPHALPTTLHRHPLYREHFVCVMRADHPLAQGRLSLARFCSADHALVSPRGGGFSGAVDEALAAQGRDRRVVASLPSFLMLPQLLEQSDLLCTVPSQVARAWRGRLAVRRPPLPLEGFEVEMVWHARTQADPARAWLREQVQAVVRAGPAR